MSNLSDRMDPGQFGLGRISMLAKTIQEQVACIEDALQSRGLPSPSFELGAPLDIPPDLAKHQAMLLDATYELQALSAGPMQYLSRIVSPVYLRATFDETETVHLKRKHSILFAIQVLHRYQIPQRVPFPGASAGLPTDETTAGAKAPKDSISFSALASSTGLSETILTRVLRVLTANYIFREPREGFLAHNAVSQLFLSVPGLDQWLGFFVDEVAPASLHATDAFKLWPGSNEPHETGWNLAASAKGRGRSAVAGKSIFQHLQESASEMRRFSEGYAFLQNAPAFSLHYLAESLGWDGNECPRTVVDIGGSVGSVGVYLLRRFPAIEKYVVQDLPEVVEQHLGGDSKSGIPDDLKGRLEFRPLDIFAGAAGQNGSSAQASEQLFQGADVYLLRNVLHDWSDKYAASVLWRITPALRRESSIVVNEICLPPPGVLSNYQEQLLRGYDVSMMHILNAKERSAVDWQELVRSTGLNLTVHDIKQVHGAAHAVIKIGYEILDEADAT